jgi:hypothetical protein
MIGRLATRAVLAAGACAAMLALSASPVRALHNDPNTDDDEVKCQIAAGFCVS